MNMLTFIDLQPRWDEGLKKLIMKPEHLIKV